MGQLLYLDDFRPTVADSMRCLFCGTVHILRHVKNSRSSYFPCPGCDETSSVPEWSLELR
jgi:hypothetical protein